MRDDGFEDVAIVVKKKETLIKVIQQLKKTGKNTVKDYPSDMRVNTRWLTNQADPDVISMQDITKN